MNRWTHIVCVILLGTGCLSSAWCQAEEAGPAGRGLKNPFGAMNTCVDRPKHPIRPHQADMLQEFGYDGYGDSGTSPKELKQSLVELRKRGLKMYATYIDVYIDPGNRNPNFKPALEVLQHSGAVLWLHVNSREYKPSDEAGDPRAVEILRKVADTAQQYDTRVALYPHFGSWLQSVGDAIRLAKKVDRDNLGVTINLCHWLRVDGEENMRPMMEKAMPYLFMVTICGADSGCKGKDWDVLLQRLDKGTFDVYNFLKTLDELGYTGPILLQGIGVKGTPRERLEASMGAWRRFSARMAEDSK